MNLLDIDITGYDTLLLDRDGVINRLRPNDYVKCWEEFEFLPGVFEALKKWTPIVKHIFVVTNQRGVGKGVMSENDLLEIHQKMIAEIENHGEESMVSIIVQHYQKKIYEGSRVVECFWIYCMISLI